MLEFTSEGFWSWTFLSWEISTSFLKDSFARIVIITIVFYFSTFTVSSYCCVASIISNGECLQNSTRRLQLCLLFLLGKPWKSARVGSLRPFCSFPSATAQFWTCVWPSVVFGRCWSFSIFLLPNFFLFYYFPPKILVNSFCLPFFFLHIVPGSVD